MINPVRDNILVRLIDKDEVKKETMSPGGVIIPVAVTGDRQRSRRAKIIKCGPDINKRVDYKVIGLRGQEKLVRAECPTGTNWKPGDVVVVHWYAGTFMDGLTLRDDVGYADLEEYRLITPEEIIGCWED